MKISKLLIGLLLVITASASNANTSNEHVQEFVKNWFAGFDQNAPESVFTDKLASQDLEMAFPEITLHSTNDFHQWYANIQNTIQKANHQVKSVRILQHTSDEIIVDIRVLWTATSYSGENFNFNAKQIWTLINEDGSLKIKSYIVTEDKDAQIQAISLVTSLVQPSHSNDLSCTCYGGPGNYRYACAPVKKTCYGGPGNYAYDCSVCQ